MTSLDRNRQQSQMASAMTNAKKDDDKSKEPIKKNDIREIRTLRQLARVNLDLDSPRMK